MTDLLAAVVAAEEAGSDSGSGALVFIGAVLALLVIIGFAVSFALRSK